MIKRIAAIALFSLIGIVGVAWIAGFLYTADASIPAGLPGTITELDGIALRVLQEGTGSDILMIHGSPGMLEDFDAQARELRTTHRVTRYDRPGHGFSGDGGRYSLAHNARTALALIEKLGLERTVVVGHSYGGSTALALAQMKSPRVAAVVVVDSAVYQRIRPINPLYRLLRLPRFGLGLARLVPRGRIEATVAQSLAGEFKASAPSPQFTSLRTTVFSQPKVLHAVANEHWDSDGELARQSPGYGEIEIPVYIAAQADDPSRRATAEKLGKQIARAEVLLVPASGHYVQVEQPAAITELIRRAAD
ncbi:MAG TPA: alpha/beta hydrolase [Terriglobales bacterium]|nr:alpha/beta hydrolase [Terriglobales bacterium]